MKIFILATLLVAIAYAGQVQAGVEYNCKEVAQKAGNTTYIFGFEGLVSYNSVLYERLKEHQQNLRVGKASTFKRAGSMGFLTKIFLSKFVEKNPHGFEFFVFPEKIKNRKKPTKADQCIKEVWEATGGNAQMILLGHSFGGFEVINVATRLPGVRFDQAVTMDARAYPGQYKYFIRTHNVRNFRNYYQLGGLPGHKIKGVDSEMKINATHVSLLKKVYNRFEADLLQK